MFLLGGFLIVIGLGLVALGPRPSLGAQGVVDAAGDWASHQAQALCIGLGLIIPTWLTLGVLGVPFRPSFILGATGGLAVLLFISLRRPSRGSADQDCRGTRPVELRKEPAAWRWIAAGVALWAILLFLFKVYSMPLWSWDHFAIWGAKAQRLVVDGRLDVSFLHDPALRRARPDYPLGLPMAWNLFSLGSPLGPGLFKLCHLGFGLALLALLHRGVRIVTRSRSAGWLTVAIAAAQPLFWDTEAVGLAEMPLMLMAMAAATSLLLPVTDRGSTPPWHAGVLVGILPWIKQEGLPLALLLIAGWAWLAVSSPDKKEAQTESRKLRLPASLIWSVALLVGGFWFGLRFLGPGVSFFRGDVLSRGLERLPMTGALLVQMGKILLTPETLFVWPLFLIATSLAWWKGRLLGKVLSTVVITQLALYGLVSFVTYLPPDRHIEAAFVRISTALLPLALLAIAAALSDSAMADSPQAQSAATRAPSEPPGGATITR